MCAGEVRVAEGCSLGLTRCRLAGQRADIVGQVLTSPLLASKQTQEKRRSLRREWLERLAIRRNRMPSMTVPQSLLSIVRGQRAERGRSVVDSAALSTGDAVSKVPAVDAAVLAAFEIAQLAALEIRR